MKKWNIDDNKTFLSIVIVLLVILLGASFANNYYSTKELQFYREYYKHNDKLIDRIFIDCNTYWYDSLIHTNEFKNWVAVESVIDEED
ncbi:MAG: hypothetical protein J1F05_03405 [Muribaculaceae bacterium]|nr:hypothetical protein [Muribaculaceae bacterium]